MGELDGETLRVSPELEIPFHELDWRFGPSGGPGGQHANRSSTKAEVRFDIEASTSLDDEQRRRLVAAFGPAVTASASDERSQYRNREQALARLRTKLAGALVEPAARRPTRPSAAVRRRRLDEKRRQAERKQARRPPSESD